MAEIREELSKHDPEHIHIIDETGLQSRCFLTEPTLRLVSGGGLVA